MIIATVLTATTGSAGAAEANPDLDPSCDIDVSLVLDASGSIQGFGAVPDMRQLGLGLVEGLTDRGTRLGVVEFGTFADEPIPLTPVTGATAAEIFNPYFSGRASPSYYDGRVGRYTNWDDGLRLVAGKDERPDLVIFVSDGVPNTIGSQATAVANNGGTPAEAAGVAALHADALKAAGTHVLAVGVAGLNDAAGIDLLTSLSGDQSIAEAGPLAGDYFVGDFADLASTFDQLVRAMCGGTLLVRSVVDVDGDLTTTDDRVPAEGRPITVSSPDGTATLSRPETGPQGSVVVNFDWAHGATSVSSTITQSPPEGYYVATTNCAGADAPGTFDGGYTQRAVTVARTDTARCTFVNKELPAVLDFDLKVDRIVDVDGSGDNSVGDVIHYRAVAVNVGGAVLENVVIGSELVSWDTCSPDQGTDLGRAERLVCRGTLVIGGDPPPGAIVHLATAQADQIPVVADTELTVLPSARLAFDKEVIRVEDRDGSGDSSVGDVVHYRLTATNVGDANLTEVAVADPLIPDLSCIPAIVVVLSPGQRVVCDGTVTITADHLGSAVTNQAQATSRQTGIVRDGERLNVPDLGVRLNTMYLGYDDNDDNGAPSRGDEVRILNVATNTGGSMLSRTAVSDDRSRDLTCESVSPWLEPGVSRHCYGSYLVTRSDHGIDLGLRGRLTTAQLPDVTDTDTMPVPRAELDVQGSLYQLIDNDSSQDPSPGDVAVFRFGVTNVGEMTLTEVEFHQFGLVGVTCTGRADGRLGVGEFIECYGEHPITRSDVGTTVAPQGRASSWQAIEDTSVVELPVGVPDASIDMVVLRIVDTDEDGRTSVGDRIEYRVTVTNTGTANLADVSITDAQSADFACEFPAGFNDLMAPGDVHVCRGSHTLIVDDAGTTVVNSASLESPQLDRPRTAVVSTDVPLFAACPAGYVDFGDTRLTGPGTRSRIEPLSLSPGRYEVTLVSYDPSHGGGTHAQGSELWYVDLVDRRGRSLATSNTTSDLADDDLIERYTVDVDLVVPDGVVGVRARHGATAGLNSVTPLCVGLELVGGPDSPPPGDPDPTPDPPAPAPPLACRPGDIDLGRVLLMNHDGYRSVDVDVAIKAGTYAVTGVSEDAKHAAGYQAGQTAEQWRIDFVTADGRVIASSGYTDDLAEDVTLARSDMGWVELVEPVSTLRLVHIATGGIDSIQPVCAAFSVI